MRFACLSGMGEFSLLPECVFVDTFFPLLVILCSVLILLVFVDFWLSSDKEKVDMDEKS